MLTTEDFDALRPYAGNFDAAPPHLVRKLDAHIEDLNAGIHEEFAAVQPPVPPVIAERNRKNAQRSTGPKSVAGKAASSQNRLAHGLCAKSLIVAGETEADFEELRQSIVAAYQPVNAKEILLTDQVAQALWRYNRAQRIESTHLFFGQTESQQILASRGLDRTTIDKVSQDKGDSLTIGLFFRDVSYQNFERIQRYLITAERSYQRAVKLLQHAQEKRRKLPQPVVPVAPEIAAEPLKVAVAGSAIAIDYESGFVPQNVRTNAANGVPKLESPNVAFPSRGNVDGPNDVGDGIWGRDSQGNPQKASGGRPRSVGRSRMTGS